VARSKLIALAVAAAALTAQAGAGGALASYPQKLFPNWPALLPPDGNDSEGKVLLALDFCQDGTMRCPAGTIDEMIRRWRPLDRACDHDAVFALTYLRTTQTYYRTVKRDPSFFSDLAWLNHEDAVFARLYFKAYDRYQAGQPVPTAWRIAFDAAGSANVTGIGDLLLGMNAHIDRDLPYALADVGLVKPDGSSRKADHDKVNLFLDRVIDPLQTELARRYDALFGYSDAEPSPFDEAAALHFVRSLRENAWRNAERLVNAKTQAERRRVAQSIEQESAVGALSILAANTVPGYGPVRDAHCRAA
jgi:hypothetical protein